jgi:hypothetical protein
MMKTLLPWMDARGTLGKAFLPWLARFSISPLLRELSLRVMLKL